MTDIRAQRASAGVPNGRGRMAIHFDSQLRSKLVQRDGKNFFEFDGYATVFNKPYKMYDMFGEYTEQISGTALDESLARGPDVVFLTNHRGLTMARTTNGTLTLEKDVNGLHMVALLNAERMDARELSSAVNDKLITEMSFAFMIDDNGISWNDDYTQLTLTKIDIDRGDVSAVNYGANPYTSIGSRASDIIRELRELPAGALADAQEALNGVYAFAAGKLADKSSRRFRDAASALHRASVARAQAMRAEGKTDEEISAAFPDLDFSDWVIVDETGEDDKTARAQAQRATTDPDEMPAELAKAVDATLDSMSAILDALDYASQTPEVQQAIDLLHAGEATVDELLDALGATDPDDMDSAERKPSSKQTTRASGAVSEVKLLAQRLAHIEITGDSR